MKRWIILVSILLTLQILSVAAYEIEVDSFSESEVVLRVSGLETVDVKVTQGEATAESKTISDTYTVDTSLSTEGTDVLITIDVSPIFEDYTPEQIDSIAVSGMLEIEGIQEKFGKRVPLRRETSPQRVLAPAAEETSALIYWVVGLALILVVLILLLFYRKPQRAVPVARKKASKRRKAPKKKKAVKKAKKRL